MENFSDRLNEVMLEKGMTQQALADKAGMAQASINKLTSGKAKQTRKISAIASALGVNTDWLATGEGQKYKVTAQLSATLDGVGGAFTGHIGDNLTVVARKIPLLSWVRAGDFCNALSQFTLTDAEDWLPNPINGSGSRTFALTVRGDSMDTPDGYREGEIVYIDPDISPTVGKDVLARLASGTTLKRYKEDEEGPYLLQLNGNKIIRPTEPWHVCGVVVFAGRRC